MANGKSDIQTKLENPALNTTVNGSTRELEVRYSKFIITLLGNEANNAYHTLLKAWPHDVARIVPEESRIRKITGTYSSTVKLQKVATNGTGSATDLTTAVAYTGSAVHVFVAADALALPAITKEDELRLTFPAVTTTNAGAQFEVIIAWTKEW